MTTVVISDNTTGADYTGLDDVHIKSSEPTNNKNGDATIEFTGWVTTTDVTRTLIKFTGLSNITPPVTVNSVTLELYATAVTWTGSKDVEVWKVLRDWSVTSACWNYYTGTTVWTTAGASDAGTDIESAASATVTVSNSVGLYKSFSSAQMAADVEDWINNGSNYGWLMKLANETGTSTYHRSAADSGTDGQRAKLTVDYTTGQVSSPSSDITTGAWTPSTGASLFGTIDEATADDADYDSAGSASTMEVKFTAVTDPGVATGHQVKYRVAGGTGSLVMSLRQGSSQIATWTVSPLPATATTYTGTLTSAEAESITDYSDLRLRVVSSTST